VAREAVSVAEETIDVTTEIREVVMTDVITRPITSTISRPIIAMACTHEVHELCRLASCECGCHGSHD